MPRCCSLVNIVNNHLIPTVQSTVGHVPAHGTKSDESYLHCSSAAGIPALFIPVFSVDNIAWLGIQRLPESDPASCVRILVQIIRLTGDLLKHG